MNARLVSLDYNVPSCDMRLEQLPLVVGRASDADIRLDDQSVSNHHCRIEQIDGELTVRDLGSLHGTFVNSCRVEESTLEMGDELSVGMLTFLVQPAAACGAAAHLEPSRPTVAAL